MVRNQLNMCYNKFNDFMNNYAIIEYNPNGSLFEVDTDQDETYPETATKFSEMLFNGIQILHHFI